MYIYSQRTAKVIWQKHSYLMVCDFTTYGTIPMLLIFHFIFFPYPLAVTYQIKLEKERPQTSLKFYPLLCSEKSHAAFLQ